MIFLRINVKFSLIDENEDKYVDILAVSIAPSAEKEHKVILTRKVVCDFAGLVGAEDKMCAKDIVCPFYGFYNKDGKQVMSGEGFKAFVSGEFEVEHMDGGFAFWLDESIKEFDPFAEEQQAFTGMCMNTVQMRDGDEPLDEYTVNFGFAVNAMFVQ